MFTLGWEWSGIRHERYEPQEPGHDVQVQFVYWHDGIGHRSEPPDDSIFVRPDEPAGADEFAGPRADFPVLQRHEHFKLPRSRTDLSNEHQRSYKQFGQDKQGSRGW